MKEQVRQQSPSLTHTAKNSVSTFPATDPNPPHVQQAALTTPHNVFIYREDVLSMARPEVEALQDRILLEQLASTDTAIDVSRTSYIQTRRAQLITLSSMDDLNILIGVISRAVDQDTYSWYAPLHPADGELFFTHLPKRLATLIDRGHLRKLVLIASSGSVPMKEKRICC